MRYADFLCVLRLQLLPLLLEMVTWVCHVVLWEGGVRVMTEVVVVVVAVVEVVVVVVVFVVVVVVVVEYLKEAFPFYFSLLHRL